MAIIGGAVAGSEAAAACAARGAIPVVFEQGARPYGKIEDGLPRWHEKLRAKEYRKINENLGSDEVWDNWQIEGPGMVSYFRGKPHVHAWLHIAKPA